MRGRPRVWTNQDATELRLEVLRRTHENDQRTTTRDMCAFANEEGNLSNGQLCVGRRTMATILRSSGLRWGKGAFWRISKISNRLAPNSKILKKAEIFLDESYILSEHGRVQLTWYQPRKHIPTPKGRGDRYCMIGAGLLWQSSQREAGLRGETLFFDIWKASTKNPTANKPWAFGNVNHENFKSWFTAMCKEFRSKCIFFCLFLDFY